tara:strand:- start:61 stop:729 length:669 start_codon:yes stop_codon:yes gene_type:complete
LTKTYHSLLDPAGEVAPDVLPLTGYHKKQIALARQKYGEAWRGGVKNLNVLGKQLRLETAVRNHSNVCACMIHSNRTIVFDQGTNPEGDRYMSKQEMLRFQGFPSDVKSEGLSNNQLSNLIGNAMNISVLKALLGNIIVGLTDVVQSGKGGELGAREGGKKKTSKTKKGSLSGSVQPPPSDRRPTRRVSRGSRKRSLSLKWREVRLFHETVNGKSKLVALLE